MKLLTHNFLSSKFLKGATTGYPLKMHCEKKEFNECEFDDAMLGMTVKKLEYDAFKTACIDIGEGQNLPAKLPESTFGKWPKELKEELHRLLFRLDIIEGELECPDTGKRFPIKDGIPNMLCTEDECA